MARCMHLFGFILLHPQHLKVQAHVAGFGDHLDLRVPQETLGPLMLSHSRHYQMSCHLSQRYPQLSQKLISLSRSRTASVTSLLTKACLTLTIQSQALHVRLQPLTQLHAVRCRQLECIVQSLAARKATRFVQQDGLVMSLYATMSKSMHTVVLLEKYPGPGWKRET